MITKRVTPILLIAAFLSAVLIARADSSNSAVTLVGTVHTGVLGPGGETTGTTLTYNSSGKETTIDVRYDKSSTSGAEFITDGAMISITGTISIVHYPERGDVQQLNAEKIEPVKGS